MNLRTAVAIMTMALAGCSSPKERALVEAAGAGDIRQLRELIDSGTDVNAVALEWTPLTQAAYAGQLDAVKLLISAGADINKPIGDLSPLFFAASRGRVEVVKELLQRGAKLNLPDANRKKFIQDVEKHQNPELNTLLARSLEGWH